MRFYVIEPEVAGDLGDRTVFDRTRQPTGVQRLHYEFSAWLGDELVESTPCYLASRRLAAAIAEAQLTGVSFDEAEVTTSTIFEALSPGRELPPFLWLKVEGQPGRDDFGVTSTLELVVSSRATDLLRHCGVSHASIRDFLPQ